MKNTAIFRVFLCLSLLLTSQIMLAQSDSKTIKDAYDFDYIYKLNMNTKKDNIQFDYYLKKDAGYFGFDISEMTKGQEGMKMFTVMDNDNAVIAMFMEMMGKKIVRKSKIKLSDFNSKEDENDFTFTKIGSKTILGYKCDGFIGENKDSKVTFYITNEAPVSFSKMWESDKKNAPKGFNPAWLDKYTDNGLLMEMAYVDKKKSKNNMTMECVGLEKTDFSIQASEYSSMLGAIGN